MTFRMLEHLHIWYTIMNGQNIAVKKHFHAPSSKMPNVHVKTYTQQLTKQQV